MQREPLNYTPNFIELDDGMVIDEGKLAALIHLVYANASSEDRAFADAHPGLDFRRRDDGMLEIIVAADGRVIGAFEAALVVEA